MRGPESLRRRIWLAIALVVGLAGILELALTILGKPPGAGPRGQADGGADTFVDNPGATDPGELRTAPRLDPVINPQVFLERKPAGTYRIVCLGGSVAYGFPYAGRTAYCGRLQAYLRAAQADRRWEVINLGALGYGSGRVLELMRELTRYQPDLFLVQVGHHEFPESPRVRPAAATQTAVAPAESPAPAGAWYRDLRLYHLWRRLREPPAEPARDTPMPAESAPWQAGAPLDPASLGVGDAWRDSRGAQWRANLNRMLELARAAGSELILVQPAARLRGQPPFASGHRPGLDAEAQAQWQAAFRSARIAQRRRLHEAALAGFERTLEIDASPAQLHYRHGESLFAAGRHAEARAAFQRALDADLLPLRVTGPMQQALRELARSSAVGLVDFAALVAAVSRRQAGHDLPGEELFLDHIHPSLELHAALATALFEHLRESGVVRPDRGWNAARRAQIDAGLDSELDAGDHRRAVLALAGLAAWAGQAETAHLMLLAGRREYGDSAELLSRLNRSAAGLQRPTEALALARQAAALYPEQLDAWLDLGNRLAERGDLEAAIDSYRRALEIDPGALVVHRDLGVSLRAQGRLEEAAAQFEFILASAPEDLVNHLDLGTTYARLGRLDAAEHHLRQVVEADPEDAYARFVLATVLDQLGRFEDALAAHRLARALDPADPDIANGLGALLARTGQLRAAIEQFRAALALQPDHAGARHNLSTALNALPQPVR